MKDVLELISKFWEIITIAAGGSIVWMVRLIYSQFKKNNDQENKLNQAYEKIDELNKTMDDKEQAIIKRVSSLENEMKDLHETRHEDSQEMRNVISDLKETFVKLNTTMEGIKSLVEHHDAKIDEHEQQIWKIKGQGNA